MADPAKPTAAASKSTASASLAARTARATAGLSKTAGSTVRKPFTSKFRSTGGSVLDSLGTLSALSALGVEKKPSIIIEIGAAYTKVGFSGEAMPRHVLRSVVMDPDDGHEVPVFSPEEQRSTAELRELLLTFMHNIMYKKLLVKTSERRAVVCEGIAVPTVYRSLVAEILYRYFMFQSVMFAPNAVLSTLPLWTDSALVVDCGHSESTAVAVFDGVAAISTFVAVSAGASEIHTQIRAALKDANADHADAIDALNERVLEDIKIRACIAGKLPEGSELPSLKYPLRGGPTLTLNGALRATALDPIFEGVGADASSIPSAILDALLECPLDSRKMLAKRILLTGGGSMLPGFKHRMSEELKALVKQPEYAELAGVAADRTVLRVKLARAGMEDAPAFVNSGINDRLLDEIIRKCDGIQVSDATATMEDGKIVLTVITPDEVDTAALKDTKINMGETSYAITDVSADKQSYHTGVSELFSFVKVQFPENILSWLGGSIIGALETLPDRSLSKEAYLKNPALPDWSDLRPRSTPAAKPDSRLGVHSRWKVVDRPRAWGCGSLAVVDGKKKTEYPHHQGYLENATFAANPILHVQ